MKKITTSVVVAMLCLFLSGCASIIHGTTQAVDFGSQPAGARISIDGREVGVTPKTVDLRRKGRTKEEAKPKQEYAIRIEMEGYMPYEMKIKRELDAWFFGNLIFGGLIGIIIDASNGAMYKLTPDQIIAQMGRVTAMNEKNGDKLFIGVTLTPDPSWERVGTLSKAE